MSIEIKRSDKYVDYNISATNNRGYITIDTSDWINKPWMFYELPALKFEIYTETNGELVKYQNFTREIRTYNPVYSPLGVLNVTIDIRNVPEEFILRITPIFDNDAIAARNMLIENGIENGDIWGSDQDVPTQLFNLDLEFIECEGEYVPPTPPVPPTHKETITGIPPITFDGSTGEPLVSWTILGNGQQTGTPSPDNIIMPEFVGVRTAQLFDKSKTTQGKQWNSSGELVPASSNIWHATDFIAVDSSKSYIRSSNGVVVGNTFFEFDESKEFIRSAQSGIGNPIQPSSSCKYITFNIDSVNNPLDTYMLTQGTTAPTTYEPYGYKILISCGGENLFDKNAQAGQIYVTDSVLRYGVEIPVTAGTYTISGGTAISFAKTKIGGVYGEATSLQDARVFTLASDGYILVYASRQVDYDGAKDGIMLNLGNTAKPYAPYSRQTTPVYLGEVQTVRRIGKIVLTGDEDWGTDTNVGVRRFYAFFSVLNGVTVRGGWCTHFKYQGINAYYNCYKASDSTRLYFFTDHVNTVSGFKSWLAAQYAAGTPVTVWYVLAEPTTGIVNEPLAKIGDYADELSSADAGVTIPTTEGQNTLTVDTDLQPSEMTITYIKEGQ